MNTAIVAAVILLVALILLGSFVFPVSAQSKENREEKNLSKYDLLWHTIDPNPEQTKAQALEEYKICPPLRPERFRRKVKMLWGIDINDYPDNAIISVGGYGGYIITLSKNDQLFNDDYDNDPNDPIIYVKHDKSVFSHLRGYVFMNDQACEQYLTQYIRQKQESYFGHFDVNWTKDNIADEYLGSETADFFFMFYGNAFFKASSDLFGYNKGAYTPYPITNLLDMAYSSTPSYDEIPPRYSDIRLDAVNLFLDTEIGKGKNLDDRLKGKEEEIQLGLNLNDSILKFPKVASIVARLARYPATSINVNLITEGSSVRHRPWHNYSAERGISAFMNFILQLQDKYMDKFVIQFMAGNIEEFDKYIRLGGYRGRLQKNIKTNNYYGYTVFREFCENPMREMPTLEKIGTQFTAKVKQNNTLLLLEPFADSYDIDTIQSDEVFKTYEMGHDDYYFIEIEKPVESPVADKDGYAMILDRTETVHGYLPKSLVAQHDSEEMLQESRYNNKTKSHWGLVSDKDGYVNIRKEPNTKSKIVGTLVENKLFRYWKTHSNWYIIETKNGIRGYVHKSRIREKLPSDSWALEEQ